MIATTPASYSAMVRLSLRVEDQVFKPAQIGGGMLIFNDAIVLPGSSGELQALIDSHLQRWQVTWEPSDTPRDTIFAEFRELVTP